MTLGEYLRARRAGLRLTLGEVSDRSAAVEGGRVPASTLGRIERDERSPGFESLVRIAAAYDVVFSISPAGWSISWRDERGGRPEFFEAAAS